MIRMISDTDRKKLREMLGSSSIQIASPLPGKLDTHYISASWDKARARRHDDPEDAITAARTHYSNPSANTSWMSVGVEFGDNADLAEIVRPDLEGTESCAEPAHRGCVQKRILGGV